MNTLKGVKLPQVHSESQPLMEMEAVTAACLMLETDCYRQLGGFSTDYIVGDFEDSDLCLKLRSLGLSSLLDRAAIFYHLERQSVNLASQTDRMKIKLVAANAITHHQRWCSVIERIKRNALEVAK